MPASLSDAATPVIALHGGAGTISRAQMSAARTQVYLDALHRILLAAQALLADGGSALDAVSFAVQMLEDEALFNAGRGAVFTADGTHELDAAIMDGRNLQAGAVTGLRRVRHPVLAARAVMAHGQHVLMSGDGAETIAREAGLEMVEPDWFSTPERLAQLRNAQARQRGVVLDHDGTAAFEALAAPIDDAHKMGTVGAVALDAQGHLAAATSTGGMTNKRPGRIGDSPLVGAGTYADDRTAAVSCTGHGEAFIRTCAAHDVCARMAYAGMDLAQASHAVVHQALPSVAGSGGLIAVSRTGQVCLPFNTEGMYRGFARVGHAPRAFIFRETDSV